MNTSLHDIRRENFGASSDEAGSVLILTAMLLVALILMAALAVDTLRLTTSKSQQRHTAEYVALAALESFLAAAPQLGADPSAEELAAAHETKLKAALKRAEELAGENFLLGAPGKEQALSGELGYAPTYATYEGQSTAAGVLRPGRWWFIAPEDCSLHAGKTCPCPNDAGGAAKWNEPCFEETAAGDNNVNAFRVSLNTKADSPIQTIFARVAGHESVPLRSMATAALAPRHILFLVDLSSSVHGDTHLRSDSPTGIPQSEYVYRLLGPGPTYTGVKYTCASEGEKNPCPVDWRCLFQTNGYGGADWRTIYNKLDDTRGGVVGPYTRHFKDDYSCHIVTFRDEATGVSQTGHYLIDSRPSHLETSANGQPTQNYYAGPEPLFTILDGIHSSLEAFERRAVAGDMAGIIGFDDRIRIDKRIFPLAAVGSSEFSTMKSLTDVNDRSKDSERIQHYLFPEPERMTDTLNALRYAESLLTAATVKGLTDNSIVLFTDGLSNCRDDLSTPGAQDCTTNDFLHHSSSLFNISDTVMPKLRDEHIKLHVVLASNLVQPHTLLAKSWDNPDRCMTQAEAAQHGVLFTDPMPRPNWCDYNAEYTGISAAFPFHWPNFYYNFTNNAGGTWAPLRECCTDSTGACADVTSTLDAACKAAAPVPGLVGNKECWSPVVKTPQPIYDYPNPYPTRPYADKRGRVVCDPKGRSKRQQMDDYINTVMEKNPYLIVE